MQLTQDQIQELFVFTEKKFVRYYDLQVELVDHLAERIEEKLSSDASLNFDAALQMIYKDFGIFGFSKIVHEKSEQLRKQNNKRLLAEIKNPFRWPEVIASLALALFIWTLINLTDKLFMDVLFVSFLVISASIVIWTRKKYSPHKKIMMTENMPDHLGLIPFIYQFVFLKELLPHHSYGYALFMFSAIIFQIACFRIGKKLRQEAKINYPAAFA
ncbi:MAG: hypothetical protein H0V30_05585 [Chitinophagaceae bacterium]|nr:hypothetical protein [Chitinophagaceae bacterium]